MSTHSSSFNSLHQVPLHLNSGNDSNRGLLTLSSLLGPTFPRILIDKSAESRVTASTQIESMVRSLRASNKASLSLEKRLDNNSTDLENAPSSSRNDAPSASISFSDILMSLNRELLQHPSPSHRKGGLLGVASVAIGLEEEVVAYLDDIVPTIMIFLSDTDSRVRYSACEAMYNVAKVSQKAILEYISDIFDGLCKISADVDMDVRNGAQYLDRVVKDIIIDSKACDISAIIPFLEKSSKGGNPFVRQLVLSWITMLDNLPEVDMIPYIPWILDGLFLMLTDTNRDIRQNADACLTEYLKEIKAEFHSVSPTVLGEIAKILIPICGRNEKLCRLTALVWLHEFMIGAPQNPALQILYPEIISVVLPCIADEEEEISRIANEAHKVLLNVVVSSEVSLNMNALIDMLLSHLIDNAVIVKISSLQWLSVLLYSSRENFQSYLKHLIQSTLNCLKTLDAALIEAALSLIGQIARTFSAEDFYPEISTHFLQLFENDRDALEKEGQRILRQLCSHVDLERFYSTLASSISSLTDFEFAHQLLQVCNWILLTAGETKEFRMKLKQPGFELFVKLLCCWFHNPISALSLCLWAEEYELAYNIVLVLGSLDVTVQIMVQFDRLVQLIESPIFASLRLHLLEPKKHPFLIKTILGICMLLPRNDTQKILCDRLTCVNSALYLELGTHYFSNEDALLPSSSSTASSTHPKDSHGKSLLLKHESNVDNIMEEFNAIMQKHQEFISSAQLKNMKSLQSILKDLPLKKA